MKNPGAPRNTPAGWHPDQNSGVLRYWDGQEWTAGTQPLSSADAATVLPKRNTPVKWIAALSAMILFATGSAIFVSSTADENDQWSAFPMSLTCAEDTDSNGLNFVPNSTVTTVKQAKLTHEGGQKLALSIEFALFAPPHPSLVRSPFSGEQIFAPGTLDYRVSINRSSDETGLVLTALTSDGWGAMRSDLGMKQILGKKVPSNSTKNLLMSFNSSGNTVRMEYDLDGQTDMFGDGAFAPTVRIATALVGPATAEYPEGIRTNYAGQSCSADALSAAPQPPTQPVPVAAPETADTTAAREEDVAELLASHRLPFNLPVGPADDVTEMDPSGMGASLCYQLKTNNLTFNGTTSLLSLDQAHQWIKDVVTVYCPENITRIPW
ncbi:DUF2510 domain-containing protein [Rhodococcus qingshengii]|uniref:DUF2510 domain-containing protein n=1 Tax=Rhodococcus qingshengii TaxID=334542 RepID=UPI0022B5C370|nr:DUF2510 domain-containing protein [Rhodococcus qingshengii]MCZ4618540.1 DUF2510 domain-containing protein [Rhodococcus qingshengii]